MTASSWFLRYTRLVSCATLMFISAQVRAQNFSGDDSDLLAAAEAARVQSARFWSNKPLPGRWSSPCPIEWSRRMGGGSGMTRFEFDRGEVSGWRMTLCGNRAAILSDVIPHEVDHAVRASLCRRPLPRWLDEGCATLFETESAHAQLRERRQTSRRQILTAATIDQMSYPNTSEDTLVLYAEGFSLVEYLLEHGTPQDLLRVQRAASPPSQSLVQVYRREIPDLLAGWRQWEKQRLSRGHSCECVGCRWHHPQSGDSSPAKNNPGIVSGQTDPRPVLTVWSAAWCRPCQQFHHDDTTNDSFRNQLRVKYCVVIRDFDQERADARRMGVTTVPLFLTEDHRIEGYLGAEWLLQQLGVTTNDASSQPVNESIPQSTPETAVPVVGPGAEVTLQLEPGQITASDLSSSSITPQLPTVTTSGSGIWAEVLSLVPPTLSLLTSLGVIGGSAMTGGVGGVALMLLVKFLRRRATRSASGKSTQQGGVAVPARAPFPRQLDEAGELLGLRQSEGRVATLDTLRGMFLDDELEKLTTDSNPQVAALVRQIRTAVDNRVDEVAPLTTQG